MKNAKHATVTNRLPVSAIVSLCALMLLIFSMLIQNAAAGGTIAFENVTFGFKGKYKVATWAPLDVTVRSENEPFDGELRVEVRNFFPMCFYKGMQHPSN